MRHAMVWGAFMHGAAPVTADEKITYVDHVRPLLANRCLNCHNADRLKGGLDLSAIGPALAGGSGGAVLKPGDPDGSTLLAVVKRTREPFMPPSGSPLNDTEIDLIRRWIAGGCLETASSAAPQSATPVIAAVTTPAPAADATQPIVARYPLADIVATARGGAVLDLAAHPTRPLIAATGQKQVLLLDGRSAELIGVLPVPRGFPNTLRFSRSGRVLVAGIGEGARTGGVAIWSTADGRLLGMVGDETDSVLAADIDPLEQSVALGGPSRRVKVFSTSDGQLRHRIDKHTDWVTAVAYSPDGVLLATADRGGNVHLWEADSAAPYLALASHPAAVTALAWRGDSNLLATACEDGRVRWFEVNGGAMVKDWPAHEGGCLKVCFAVDGRSVTAGRDRHVKLWDANGGMVRSLGPMEDLALAAVLVNGSAATAGEDRIIAGDWSGRLRVWSAMDGNVRGDATAGPLPWPEQLDRAIKEGSAVRESHGKSLKARDAAQAALAGATDAHNQAKTARIEAAAARASAQAAAEAANQEVEQLGRAREEAAGRVAIAAQATAAAAGLVESSLQALKTAVDADAAAQAAVAGATSSNAVAATQPADASETAAALARAAQTSEALKSAMAASDAAKAQRTAAVAAEQAARGAMQQAESLLAAATARRNGMVNQTAAAQAGLEQAQAREREAEAALNAAKAAADQAAKSEQDADQAVRWAEARLALWRAGEVRKQLDAAREALAQEEARFAPIAAVAAASRRTAERVAAELNAMRAQLSNAPATLAEMARSVQAAEQTLRAAEQHAEIAQAEHRRSLEATARFSESVEALRRSLAAAPFGDPAPTSTQPAGSAPGAIASPPAAAAVAAEPAGSAALAKAEEALALLRQSAVDAQQKVERTDRARDAAKIALATARQRAADAEIERAKLPDRIVQQEAVLTQAQARMKADADVAAEARRPVDAARAKVGELEQQYESLVNAAALVATL